MLEQGIRQAILELHRRGQGVRAIARALQVSRAAVRDVLRRGSAEVPRLERPEKALAGTRIGLRHETETVPVFAQNLERPVRRMRHRDVAGQDVVEGRDVRRTLDVRVPTKREDAAAGPPHVAQKELDDRGRAYVLDPDRVLGPADRVDERRGPLAPGVAAK